MTDPQTPAHRPETTPDTAAADRPVRTAAFFDLDKTVIAKSSTLAFSKPFFDQGLINRRTVLKSTYAQFLFLMSGADHDQMNRMRDYITNMCAGWDVEQIKSIVGETLHEIVDPLVFAEAADLIADHKLCGRDIVVVSASGRGDRRADRPRRRRHPRDGHPDGRRGRQLHRRGGVLLLRRRQGAKPFASSPPARVTPCEHCYAYSDSITDLPMLEAVGHPTVVNPDRALRKEAAARGWPVLTFSRAGVAARPPAGAVGRRGRHDRRGRASAPWPPEL